MFISLAQAKQLLGVVYESAYINISTNLVDDAILQDDIDACEAVVNSYITKTYNATITGTASLSLLRHYTSALLFKKAYSRFDSAQIPESVLQNNDETIFRLRDIAKGVSVLPDDLQQSRATGVSGQYNDGSFTGANQTIFTRRNMAGW